MGAIYYDRAGRPIPMLEWAKLFGDDAYKRVALTHVGDVSVSTVWLGLDHGFGLGGVPLIFETMVFGGAHDEDQWRWPTEAAALAGHDQAVAMVRDHDRKPHPK